MMSYSSKLYYIWLAHVFIGPSFLHSFWLFCIGCRMSGNGFIY